jgi:hypothetical protein
VSTDLRKAALGIAAWVLVGVLAVLMVEFVGGFRGAMPVLLAVIAMWLVGNRMLGSEIEEDA